MKDISSEMKENLKDFANSLCVDFPIPDSLEKTSYNYFNYSDSGLILSSGFIFDEIKISYCIETHKDYNIINGDIATNEYHYISGVEIKSLFCDIIKIENGEIIDYLELKIFEHLEKNKNKINL